MNNYQTKSPFVSGCLGLLIVLALALGIYFVFFAR